MGMKTTIELTDELYRRVKARSAMEGRPSARWRPRSFSSGRTAWYGGASIPRPELRPRRTTAAVAETRGSQSGRRSRKSWGVRRLTAESSNSCCAIAGERRSPGGHIDASVWIASLIASEPAHRECAAVVHRVISDEVTLVQPTLFLVEVAASLGRRFRGGTHAETAIDRLLRLSTMREVPLVSGRQTGLRAVCAARAVSTHAGENAGTSGRVLPRARSCGAGDAHGADAGTDRYAGGACAVCGAVRGGRAGVCESAV